MRTFLLCILAGLVVICFYLSGFILWLCYRWSHRYPHPLGRVIDGLGLFQAVACGAIVCLRDSLHHWLPGLVGDGHWPLLWVGINVLCTITGACAWFCEEYGHTHPDQTRDLPPRSASAPDGAEPPKRPRAI